jgi:hypothetical protein
MSITLSHQIDRVEVEELTPEVFKTTYFKPQKPVIINKLYGSDCKIYAEWTFDYFKELAGDLKVGVYDAEGDDDNTDRSYKNADRKMLLRDYIDLITARPTTKRLFLFNIFKHQPKLKSQFFFPKIAPLVLRNLPLAFFGGEGSVTRLHRDMDNSNVFLTELQGSKRVVLFPPEHSSFLYQLPFNTHTPVDINQPDYGRYPALHAAEGLDVTLKAGETLFIPAGWWHQIEYETASMGFAVRSVNTSLFGLLRGLLQVGVLTHVDELMRFVLNENWFRFKLKWAQIRANLALEKQHLKEKQWMPFN